MNLKRMAVVAVAASLFASAAAIALAEEHGAGTSTDETRAPSDAQVRKAQLLADYMIGDATTPLDEIIALRTGDTIVGWGAMFKLVQLAKAPDTPLLADLLAEFDEDGWAFGRRFKALSDPPWELLDDAPRNLGQLMKQQRASTENRSKKSRGG